MHLSVHFASNTTGNEFVVKNAHNVVGRSFLVEGFSFMVANKSASKSKYYLAW